MPENSVFGPSQLSQIWFPAGMAQLGTALLCAFVLTCLICIIRIFGLLSKNDFIVSHIVHGLKVAQLEALIEMMA